MVESSIAFCVYTFCWIQSGWAARGTKQVTSSPLYFLSRLKATWMLSSSFRESTVYLEVLQPIMMLDSREKTGKSERSVASELRGLWVLWVVSVCSILRPEFWFEFTLEYKRQEVFAYFEFVVVRAIRYAGIVSDMMIIKFAVTSPSHGPSLPTVYRI